MSDPGKGIAQIICFVATAVTTVIAPPVGVSLAVAQATTATVAGVASNFVEDKEGREVLKAASDIYGVGALGGGAKAL
jgi:hypothetical protein